MSEDLNVYPNARSKLFGEPEDSIGIIDNPAVPGLSGTNSTTLNSLQSPASILSGTDIDEPMAPEKIIDSIDVNYPTAFNFTHLTYTQATQFSSGAGRGPYTIRIRDGGLSGTIIASVVRPAGSPSQEQTENLSATIINHSAVLNSYVATLQQDGVASLSRKLYDNIQFSIFAVDINDTHTGIITTPATATKQINSPDSHRTHEQAVLPG